jgi:hypothetical protein
MQIATNGRDMEQFISWIIISLVGIASISVIYTKETPRWAMWVSRGAASLAGILTGFVAGAAQPWVQKVAIAVFWAIAFNALFAFLGWAYRVRLKK